jgi:hypothetical protein
LKIKTISIYATERNIYYSNSWADFAPKSVVFDAPGSSSSPVHFVIIQWSIPSLKPKLQKKKKKFALIEAEETFSTVPKVLVAPE